jgi:hypothetical protein
MTDLPPPLLQAPKKKRSTWLIAGIVVGAVVILGLGVFFAIRSVVASGITKGPDAMFGDQHLKTAVALIELHKVRKGRYLEDLSKLQFTGQWDMIALQSVRYVVAEDGSSYFVEVQRGWIGKPELIMPAEFWRGTGFNPKLAASK